MNFELLPNLTDYAKKRGMKLKKNFFETTVPVSTKLC